MKQDKLVSVIMPVYNADEHLREAIESILNQSYGNIEIIVVNDGSKDNGYTDSIIREYKSMVQYFYKENGGIADALNYAISKVNGDYIARMDQDDISLPDRIEKQVKFMETNTDVAVCGTRFYMLKDGGIENAEDYPISTEAISIALLFGNVLCHPSIMFRASAIKGKWRYSKDSIAEDYDLWLRMMHEEKMTNLPEKLLLYRIADTHYTALRSNKITSFSTNIIRKALKNKWGIEADKYRDEIVNINEFDERKTFVEKLNYLQSIYGLLKEIYERNLVCNIVKEETAKGELNRQWKKVMNKLGFSTILFEYIGIENIEDMFFYPSSVLEKMLKNLYILLQKEREEKKCINILICGAGKACDNFFALLQEKDSEKRLKVIGILDNRKEYFEAKGKTWKIHKVCEASLFSFDYVVISSYKFYRQLRNELLMSGINEKQIVYRDWVKLCYL